MSTNKTAIVTGAGTGIGKASAIALLKAGWNTVLCGRRKDMLDAAIADAGQDAGHGAGGRLRRHRTRRMSMRCSRQPSPSSAGSTCCSTMPAGLQDTLIDELPVAVWKEVVEVNLNGAFLCARAAFRTMRNQSPRAGASSTTARSRPTRRVRARCPTRRPSMPSPASPRRWRSTAGRIDIACGQIDIGNALTDMAAAMTVGVPQADLSIAIEATMDVSRVAESVLFMANLPLDANVLFMTVMATKMPFVGRG